MVHNLQPQTCGYRAMCVTSRLRVARSETVVRRGSAIDPTLQNSGTLDAGALPGDAQPNDDQIDDLTQAGYRG